jgi:hypothetical protein
VKKETTESTATEPNVLQILVQYFTESEKLRGCLDCGNLLGFEEFLRDKMQSFQTQVTQSLLHEYASQELSSLADHYREEGYNRFQQSSSSLRISTGATIELPDLYARNCEEELPPGHRNVLQRHFSIIGGSSPLCYSLIGVCAVACPSYDTGNELLSLFNVKQSTTRVRNVTNALADFCCDKEEHLILTKEETLADKKVLIAIDGGRCRSRENNKGRNADGNLLFSTDWREPKLFVIQVLKDDGSLDRKYNCFYGGRFGEQRFWLSLEKLLRSLQIELAQHVQIAADGAQWIWDKMEDFLCNLGVVKTKIIQTLDYYHSSSYLSDLIKSMPKSVSVKKREQVRRACQDMIIAGKSSQAVTKIKDYIKRPDQEQQRWMNYLTKHESKMQYADFKANGFVCGSGIIESGIRRVINLRFKNTGTFWDIDRIEKLIFLRGAYLSGRWTTLMKNIVTQLF